jgi:hypothetical protein
MTTMKTSSTPMPPEPLPGDCRDAAAVLNRGCACISVDRQALRHALEAGAGSISHADLLASRPHLFSDTMVFAGEAHLQRMADTISAIERVIVLPAYRERVLAYAPAIARHSPKAAGVFLGYDFHLGVDGPKLIEINTNAGGGLLNAKLLRAQHACCAPVAAMMPGKSTVEDEFLAMFRTEWALARGDRPLVRIAIIDETPATQYLAPEFELFRQLFEAHGIAAQVAGPEAL